MDFRLDAEETLLRDTARRLMAAECPPALVRAHLADRAVAEPLTRRLAEWSELADAPLVQLCLFLEELGAACAPGPFFATTALWAPLAASAGADPRSVGTVAMAGADGVWEVNPSPIKTFVLDADLVDSIAFVLPGPRVAIVPAGDVAVRRTETLDAGRSMFEARVPDGLRATPVPDSAITAFVARAAVACAADLVGTTRWLLETCVAHAGAREQFGRPIGSFQAIQHKLADMALAHQRARAAVHYAAMAIDAGSPDRHRAAHIAKASANAAARRATGDCVQIHGGVGFTWENDLHLWARRALVTERLLGTTDWHHDRLADLLLV